MLRGYGHEQEPSTPARRAVAAGARRRSGAPRKAVGPRSSVDAGEADIVAACSIWSPPVSLLRRAGFVTALVERLRLSIIGQLGGWWTIAEEQDQGRSRSMQINSPRRCPAPNASGSPIRCRSLLHDVQAQVERGLSGEAPTARNRRQSGATARPRGAGGHAGFEPGRRVRRGGGHGSRRAAQVHVVQQDQVNACLQGLLYWASVSHSTSSGRLGSCSTGRPPMAAGRRRPPRSRGHPRSGRRRRGRCGGLGAAAAAHGVLLQLAQARGRLRVSRTTQPCRTRRRPRRGRGGDAGQVGEELRGAARRRGVPQRGVTATIFGAGVDAVAVRANGRRAPGVSAASRTARATGRPAGRRVAGPSRPPRPGRPAEPSRTT